MMIAAWKWMRGVDGLAAAQWASALFSVLAIAIALWVFLAEQRRDNAAQLREKIRDRESRESARLAQINDRNEFVKVCSLVLADAVIILRQQRDAMPTEEFCYIDWTSAAGVPVAIAPYLRTAEAVRSARLDNPYLVLTMSRAIEVLNRLARTSGSFMASVARQNLSGAIQLIDEMRKEVEGFLVESPGSPTGTASIAHRADNGPA
jgi:hypothetical protein